MPLYRFVDSSALPPVDSLAGVVFAGYLDNGLTRAYVEELSAAGVPIVSLLEYGATDPLGGRAEGVTRAGEGVALAKALGQPAGSAIYLATDFAAAGAQIPTVVDYYAGAAEVLRANGYEPGAYADTLVLNPAFDQGVITYGFVPGAASWSSGIGCPRAQLAQTANQTTVGGVVCDVDEIVSTPFGAWTLAGPWPAPVTSPTPKEVPVGFPNAVAACQRPNNHPGQVWVLGSDGGVFTAGGAPFFGSYPGLPPADRQGERAFLAIEADPDGNGYTLLADDGSGYHFRGA